MSVNTGLHHYGKCSLTAWLCHKLTSNRLLLDSHTAWWTGDWQVEMGPELRLFNEGKHGQRQRHRKCRLSLRNKRIIVSLKDWSNYQTIQLIKRPNGVIMWRSWLSPQLLSPNIYNRLQIEYFWSFTAILWGILKKHYYLAMLTGTFY